MQFLDELRAEHETIERVALSLLTFARQPRHSEDIVAFVHFFRTYAGGWHHEREEQLLFPALEHEASLPADRGPIAVLLDDHATMSLLLDHLGSPGVAVRYAQKLLQHIDAENSVLFPESELRLPRAGVHEIASREPSDGELAAFALANDLTRRYPPVNDPSIVRGDGCALCHAYGDTCRGLEREWWNEWEWESLTALD